MRDDTPGLHVVWDGGELIAGVDRVLVVGRGPESDIRVEDERVSRVHATLRWEDGWTLDDPGSRNGTFLAGEQVSRLELFAPTVVRLGDPAAGPALDLRPVRGEAVAEDRVSDTRSTGPLQAGPPQAEGTGMGRFTGVHAVRGVVRIGRAPDSDVVLDDLHVSRRHAELRWDPVSGFELVDLGSYNGTFVNGRRTTRAHVQRSDVIGIGRHWFRVVDGGLEVFEDTGEVDFRASGLTVRTGRGETILAEIGFSLRECSLLAIVGPSGSGKSMLLKALTGLCPAQQGTVLYAGRDLYAAYDELRGRIGLVPQDDVVHTELTVEAALCYASELRFPADVDRDERAARVEAVMEELGLTARRHGRIRDLSGGQRKRASVALELLTKPSLLFLDEPTSGLDPGLERSLTMLLRSLADDGRTVVVVTHGIDSLHLCDRVLFLSAAGELAYFGPVQLALAYFGCESFQDVFDALGVRGSDWSARFRAHPDYAHYVEPEVQGGDTAVPGAPEPTRQLRHRGAWRQFVTLSRRYVSVLASDRRNVALLLLQAPLLGLLMLFALPPNELAQAPLGELRLLSRAGLVLLVIVMGVTWLGATNAVREIVKELPIFRRERAMGLSIPAYVASKAVVLGVLTVAQAIVVVALATARQGGPADAIVLGWPRGELMVVVALTGLAGMSLGLLVSALASRVDRAMAVLPIVLLVELMLAMGAVFPDVAEKPILREAAQLAATQWGFAAAAATSDLNHLQPLNAVAREVPTVDLTDPQGVVSRIGRLRDDESRWNHEAGAWLTSVTALLALIALPLGLTGLALTRIGRDSP